MERPDMEERNNKRKSSEIDDVPSECFVYTNETNDIDVPGDTMTHLRVDPCVGEILDRTFEDFGQLVHVQLPETLTQIGEGAFQYCSNLKFVKFVSTDASLETSSNYPSLEDGTIVFPGKAELKIERNAFGSCNSLRKVIVRSVSTKLGRGAFELCAGLISVELPEGLQVIEAELFVCCDSLATVNIPSSVIKIGEEAFFDCPSLASVDLPYGLLEIGDESFHRCDSLEALSIPSTVSSIGYGAFQYCIGLKHVKLPPSLQRLERCMFAACHSLEYIEIPPALKIIDDGVFCQCSSLSHVRIPPSVETIGEHVFSCCSSLISMELPPGIFYEIDLFECTSFMNVYGDMDYFFLQDTKLGRVGTLFADLVTLGCRFDNSPLTKLCYYQSYYSSEDAMLQLHSLMDKDPLAASSRVDGYGMTPLHVLSLSQTPNLDMFLALMNEVEVDHIIRSRDSFGSIPMDYLCLNRMPNSSEVIRLVLQTRFDCLLGLNRSWNSDMLQAIDEALAVDWSSRRREIIAVYLKLANYERKEILSMLELYLWKTKIDEFCSDKKEHTGDRESCRINSGASIVIPHALSFLDKLDMASFSKQIVLASDDEEE
eukprot:scaffold2747_cov104-Cylindrotheca_fusiformis.AAC.7